MGPSLGTFIQTFSTKQYYIMGREQQSGTRKLYFDYDRGRSAPDDVADDPRRDHLHRDSGFPSSCAQRKQSSTLRSCGDRFHDLSIKTSVEKRSTVAGFPSLPELARTRYPYSLSLSSRPVAKTLKPLRCSRGPKSLKNSRHYKSCLSFYSVFFLEVIVLQVSY